MFLPTTREEMLALGWQQLDVILVSGDTYIDSPFIGVATIGNILADVGYRVGIIAQPDIDSESDIGRLGEPSALLGHKWRLGGFHGRQLYGQRQMAQVR